MFICLSATVRTVLYNACVIVQQVHLCQLEKSLSLASRSTQDTGAWIWKMNNSKCKQSITVAFFFFLSHPCCRHTLMTNDGFTASTEMQLFFQKVSLLESKFLNDESTKSREENMYWLFLCYNGDAQAISLFWRLFSITCFKKLLKHSKIIPLLKSGKTANDLEMGKSNCDVFEWDAFTV